MNRDLQATTLVVVGLIIGRLTVESGYQSFVKTGLFWPLLLSSVALVSVGGVPLRLTGFVVADESANAYQLTRFAVGCCAADAAPRQVLVTNPQTMPVPGTWVVIEATWTGDLTERGRAQLPLMHVVSQTEIDEPAQPYEY